MIEIEHRHQRSGVLRRRPQDGLTRKRPEAVDGRTRPQWGCGVDGPAWRDLEQGRREPEDVRPKWRPDAPAVRLEFPRGRAAVDHKAGSAQRGDVGFEFAPG